MTPPKPGGSWSPEPPGLIGSLVALSAVGIPLAPALLAVFLYRIITFWMPVIPALLLLGALRQLNETLPLVPRTKPDRDETISFRPARASTASR